MTSPGGQPASIGALIDYLTSLGFRLVREDRGDMGGTLLVYEGTAEGMAATVEIAADRGQWEALLKFGGMRKVVLPEIWIAYLDGVEVGDISVNDQVAFVRDRLVEAAGAFRQDDEAEAKLTTIGRAYADHIIDQLQESFENP